MIQNDNRRVTYQGSEALVTEFSFAFPVFDASEIRVIKTAADGSETELVRNAADGFSVTLNGAAPSAGYVTYPSGSIGSAITTGEQITIIRQVSFTQGLDLTNGGNFRAEVVEAALDKLTMMCLQLKEELDRAIKVSAGANQLDATLPAPEAGQAIIWNGDASGLMNADTFDGDSIFTQLDAQQVLAETITPDGENHTFSLTNFPGSASAVDVYINGVHEPLRTNGIENYTVSNANKTITFQVGGVPTAPAEGESIEVRYRAYGITTVNEMQVVAPGAVNTAAIANGAVTYEKLASTSRASVKIGVRMNLPPALEWPETTDNPGFGNRKTGYAPALPTGSVPRSMMLSLTLRAGETDGNFRHTGDPAFNHILLSPYLFTYNNQLCGFGAFNVYMTGVKYNIAPGGLVVLDPVNGSPFRLNASKWTITPVLIGG